MGMQKASATICSILSFCILIASVSRAQTGFPSTVSIQSDGSLVFFDSSGGVADLVKQGTPRQSVNCHGQSLNVSYGSNSSGKKTILISLPKSAGTAADFVLSGKNVSIPPGSSLRITLDGLNQPERMEGAPAGSVSISRGPSAVAAVPDIDPATSELKKSASAAPVPPAKPIEFSDSPDSQTMGISQKNSSATELNSAPVPVSEEKANPAPNPSAPALPQPMEVQGDFSWPGKFLAHPIPTEQLEEDKFYIRTEGGARFVSSMNIVNVVGPNGPSNSVIEKEIAFSTGYRQDIDAGVWLTDWFGLAVETGFALNAIRGNTQGMTVSSSTYWSIPIMAQLCFQYPNDSGFLPYINFGFGGGWNYFNIGSINYNGPNFTTLSGSGNDMNNAYQIAAGIRYRLYDQLSLTLAYKFYGTSQPTVDMGDSQQVTFGSPVTNSIEIGGNFSF
ncbi:MAG: hypothetical protein EB090_04070 [Verrucomicrobia bacterium]|nr:hypothetical protein [Verrucomicrobiota bacterium]